MGFLVFVTIANASFALAQAPTPVTDSKPAYNYSLPKIQIGNSIKETNKTSDSEVSFAETLSNNDLLRFMWQDIELDVANKISPSVKGGYLKVYKESLKEENYIYDVGFTPLKIDKLANTLKEGQNILFFQLVLNGQPTQQTIKFSFNYTSNSGLPNLKILNPKPFTVLNKDKYTDFEIVVDNFVVKTDVKLSNHGKIKVYLNNLNEENFLTSLISSEITPMGSKLKFNSSVLGSKLQEALDSEKSKLLFLPETNDGKVLNTAMVEISLITNYQKSLNIKLPQVSFVALDSNKTVVDRDEKIKLRIDNFKVLGYDVRNTDKPNEGYMQVYINDKPHKIAYTQTEFTINELAPLINEEKINLRVQLVNANFLAIEPLAEANLEIFVKKNNPLDQTSIVEISNWRLILLGVTILLILGSVMYIVFRS
jgi:hypothetical protein